jgi:BlaI family transcriptional regulator, penicillinase repressor
MGSCSGPRRAAAWRTDVARSPSKHPTELELEILKVLWDEAPLSGRQVRDRLAPVRNLTYTSVMTVLGIMEDKRYVARKRVNGNYLYSARLSREAASQRMLRDLVDRVFGGSAATAMVNLLETSDVDSDELRQLRELIQRKAKEQS